ncbi:MAG TPA: outer membrane beta-barrel protein [Cytophagaceae bacterium]|jgi:outer membrane protein W
MKKQYFFIAIFLTLQFSAFKSSAQVYEKGNFVIDGFYGFPNLLSAILKSAAKTAFDVPKVTTVGPLGLTAEYLIGEKFGIGLEATYSTTRIKAEEAGYSYEYQFNRLRILPRVNFHFGSNDKLDPYLTVGAGYGSFKTEFKSNDASAPDLSFTVPGSLATRVGFGLRYFFTDHIGFMAEGGIGGPLVRLGLSAKF